MTINEEELERLAFAHACSIDGGYLDKEAFKAGYRARGNAFCKCVIEKNENCEVCTRLAVLIKDAVTLDRAARGEWPSEIEAMKAYQDFENEPPVGTTVSAFSHWIACMSWIKDYVNGGGK